ncbi:MAG: hypothetical protein ACRC1Z_22550 [Waterburya sp.]
MPGHSRADPEELATLAIQVYPRLNNCQIYQDIAQALDMAIVQSNQNPDRLTVLCGFLYLIGSISCSKQNV